MSTTPAFDIVFFGGTGDLALRKLIPALYHAHKAGTLHPDGRIFALGRKDLGREGYLALLTERVKPRLGAALTEDVWTSFISRLHFQVLDAGRASDYTALAQAVGTLPERATVCYLATAPHLFITICQHLAAVGLNHPNVRVVLEKPLGHDLESSNAINSKPFKPEDVLTKTVRGQYRSGAINGMAVSAYRDEENVRPDSNTETFVALQAEVGSPCSCAATNRRRPGTGSSPLSIAGTGML